MTMFKNFLPRTVLLLIYLASLSLITVSANESIHIKHHTEVIKTIQKHMLKHYVFLDKAEQMNQHLDKLINEKYFDPFIESKAFARALTKEMRRFSKDKHFGVRPPRTRNETPETRQAPKASVFNIHLERLMQFRDGGFGDVKFFDGNVAYFRLDGFRWEDKRQVDPLMAYLATSDAIIIDLRKNGGGGALVDYLSSYFLPEDILLSSTYTRSIDHTEHIKTVLVNGRKRLDVPLFILTSDRTFSAAEAFSYSLQARNRATIIGEVSGGGAHPITRKPLPHGFGFIVPHARSINPITKTNWEGVGVIPDIEVTADKALEKAKEIAKTSATQYREEPFKKLEVLLKKDSLTSLDEKKIDKLLKLVLARHHIESYMINAMAYQYKFSGDITAAFVMFKANIRVFPNEPNGHDSYAEALAENNEHEQALYHYKRAVLLAAEQKDKQLNMYRTNLANFEATL
jgi:tetratricopeptide (TPR) repeat protein